MESRELSWRERGRLWLRLGIRVILLTAAVLALIFLAPPLFSLFMPFVLAFLMAWLLHPIVRRLQKRLHISRGVLSLFLLILVFAVAGGALFAFGYSAATEAQSLVENWQAIWAGAQTAVATMTEMLDKLLTYLPAELESTVNQGLASFALWAQTTFPALLATTASHAGNFAMSIPAFAVATVVFIMASYFITADYPRIRLMVTDHLPVSARAFLSHVKKTAVDAFGGYVRAQVILSLGVFAILLVSFFIVGQEYAVLLALILAVLDFIPIIGSGTVMVPWALIALVTGDWTQAVTLMAIWGLVSIFRRVGEPKIVGSQTGLAPVLSLVSIYVGMRLGGILGMVLGPVLCLVVINICRAGVFAGLSADLRMMAQDTAALLKNTSTSDDLFKKD